MKLAGFLLLFSGWIIALTATTVLPRSAVRGTFVLAGLAVEIVGLAIAFRAHAQPKEERG